MRSLVSIFVHGFLLDALLTLVGEWLPISILQGAVAWAVFALGIVLYVATAFNRRLSKRLILPPVFFLVWTGICGAFPLAFLLPDFYRAALAITQLAIAIVLIAVHRRWRATPPPIGPAFSWRTFSLVALPTIAAIPFALVAGAVNAAGVGIEHGSHGYVKLRPGGVMLEERELSKDGRHVRLVSMMHIGDKSFYDQILASLPTEGATIVLVEGVTDDKGILKGRFSYARIAKLLGLTAQETSSLQENVRQSLPGKDSAQKTARQNVEYRHADIDISTFHPLTLEYIAAIGVILSDPTFETLLRVFKNPNTPFKKPNVEEVVVGDILDKRNKHLIDEINHALEDGRSVVVPWGALHLFAIEESLKNDGFRETRRVDRPIIRFWHDANSTAK